MKTTWQIVSYLKAVLINRIQTQTTPNLLADILRFLWLLAFVICCDPIDPCDNTICYNGGVCVDGTCECTADYEGAQCLTPVQKQCNYADFFGSINCGANSVPVSQTLCCPVNSPYFCPVNNKCYSNCYDASLAGCTTNVVKGNVGSNNSGGNNSGGDNNSVQNGQVIFWTEKDCGCGSIDVWVDDLYVGQVSSFSANPPSCGTSGFVNKALPPGNHYFRAECSDGINWNGNITITASTCSGQKLNCPTTTVQNGKVMFWTSRSDLGPLKITLNDQPVTETVYTATIIGTLTTYFSSAPSTCDVSGGITVSRKPGTYGFIVQNSSGKILTNDQVTIKSNTCLRFQLN